MKNKLTLVLLLFLVLVCPVLAQSTYTITLNGLVYEPLYSPQIEKDTLLVALDDFKAMTYSEYTRNANDSYTLYLQDSELTFSPNNKTVRLNGQLVILERPARMKSDVLYVPITFLDLVKNYPYHLSDDLTQLNLTSKLPYSSTTDTFDSHSMLSTETKALEDLFTPFMENDEMAVSQAASQVSNLVKTACKNNQYLSFISSTHKANILTKFKNLIKELPELEVTFRQVDLLASKPVIKQLETYPLALELTSNGISLSFNKQTKENNCIWTTYNPSAHSTAIDLDKTLDVTIMRVLYEYFRDTNDLKDDIHFSPITTVQMGRSDAIYYTVYSDHLDDVTLTYDVVIYKKISSGKITYIVDLITKP